MGGGITPPKMHRKKGAPFLSFDAWGWDTLLPALMHNKRAIAAELRPGGRIDLERVRLNHCLRGAGQPDEVAESARALLEVAGRWPLPRKDSAAFIEALVSLPAGSTIEATQYFEGAAQWLALRFGVSIISAEVHMDESAPHCHILLLALESGRSGWDLLGRGEVFKAHRAAFMADVAGPHGLRDAKPLPKAARDEMARRIAAEFSRDMAGAAGRCFELLRVAFAGEPVQPGEWAQALGLNTSAAKPAAGTKPKKAKQMKKQRTMTEIFTSPGKGPKRHDEESYRGSSAKTYRGSGAESYRGSNLEGKNSPQNGPQELPQNEALSPTPILCRGSAPTVDNLGLPDACVVASLVPASVQSEVPECEPASAQPEAETVDCGKPEPAHVEHQAEQVERFSGPREACKRRAELGRVRQLVPQQFGDGWRLVACQAQPEDLAKSVRESAKTEHSNKGQALAWAAAMQLDDCLDVLERGPGRWGYRLRAGVDLGPGVVQSRAQRRQQARGRA